jgi:hypothetical protein
MESRREMEMCCHLMLFWVCQPRDVQYIHDCQRVEELWFGIEGCGGGVSSASCHHGPSSSASYNRSFLRVHSLQMSILACSDWNVSIGDSIWSIFICRMSLPSPYKMQETCIKTLLMGQWNVVPHPAAFCVWKIVLKIRVQLAGDAPFPFMNHWVLRYTSAYGGLQVTKWCAEEEFDLLYGCHYGEYCMHWCHKAWRTSDTMACAMQS